MLWKLCCAIGRALVPRERDLMRGLRSRSSYAAGTRARRHGQSIFRSRSLRWNHLVGVMEARGSISWHAIVEHALKLVRILRGGRGVKESGRGIYRRRIESPILLARDVRGVGEPSVHVVRFYQPIYLVSTREARTAMIGTRRRRAIIANWTWDDKTISITQPRKEPNGRWFSPGLRTRPVGMFRVCALGRRDTLSSGSADGKQSSPLKVQR